MNDQQLTALIAGMIYASKDPHHVTTLDAVQVAREIMDAIYKTEPEDTPDPKLLNQHISALGLSVRVRNAIVRDLHIERDLSWNDADKSATIGHLISKTARGLMLLRNFGEASINEVRKKLGERGLALNGESPLLD